MGTHLSAACLLCGELAARLEELGVEHELHIFEGEPHSFDTTDSEAARESLDLQIAFMDHFTRWKIYPWRS